MTTGSQIAMIVTGGDIAAGTELSENDLLALERKAFRHSRRHGRDTGANRVYAGARHTAPKLIITMIYNAPIKDMLFLLNECFGLEQLRALPGNEELDADLLEAMLEEAGKFAAPNC